MISRAGIKNRDTKIENRVSILDSILDSRKDRESSVNLLLNGTVCVLEVGGGSETTARTEKIQLDG